MFDTLYIGMSGMDGFSKGLKVISNNLANLNSPGFRSSTLQFTDAYYLQQGLTAEGDGGSSGGQGTLFGSGVQTLSTFLDLHAGDTQQTSNPLDVAVSGEGYLVARDKQGTQTYTRDGQLEFDRNGDLVSTTTGKYIMGYAGSNGGILTKISLDGLRTNPAKATANVTFSGNLTTGTSTTGATTPPPTATFAVIDDAGGQHSLVATFTRGTAPGSTLSWNVAVTDGATNVGSGTISFSAGSPDPAADKVTFAYAPGGRAPFDVTLDFSTNVTAFDTGNLTTLAVASQDGFSAGSISKTTFDSDGKLTLTYSNGQTMTGAQLALATFDTGRTLQQLGAAEFTSSAPGDAHLGRANTGGTGTIVASAIEESNVNLSSEFSNLIVMQRGYQASSNVLSTVNDMLQELFDMRGGR